MVKPPFSRENPAFGWFQPLPPSFWCAVVTEARSSFAEQSTPALLGIVDGIASVSQIGFVDKDLEAQESGAKIWGILIPTI